ncbi:MAG: hypothetical protein Q6373_008960 [Candidatus Sigynarchaeota archaeon]
MLVDGAGRMVDGGLRFAVEPKTGVVRGLIALARDTSIQGQPLLPVVNWNAKAGEFVATFAVRTYTGAAIAWDKGNLQQNFDKPDGTRVKAYPRLWYALNNGLPATTVTRTGGTKASLEVGDVIVATVNGKRFEGVVRQIMGDAVHVSTTKESEVDLPTGKPVAIATTSGDWTGTITAGLTAAQHNLARALDASGINYIESIQGYHAPKDSDGNLLPLTPDERMENLQKMLAYAMNNLFAKKPTTVTFSIGFLVGGPHQALVDAAGLVPRHIRQFYP